MTLVYSDHTTNFYELLAGANSLKNKTPTTAVTFGTPTPEELTSYGADIVIHVDSAPKEFKVEEYSEALKTIITEEKHETILIGSTKNGKELAGRLSAQLDTACVIDGTNLTYTKTTLQVDRIEYSGNAVTTQQFTKTPYIITIPPKYYNPQTPDTSTKAEIKKLSPTISETPSKITETKALQTEGANVEDAEIIVSCGRGLKNKDDIKIIQNLADVLKGKTVGCSRPIAADMKWLSEDHWIGLSGHKVKPKLYIAVGISGQIQHIAGMRDSDIIVAVNKDPEALIFNSADYGIVGDLYEVLPKLTTAIKEKMG